ncbi:hypothetical protein E1B28_004737 [Marasmius oreades]|uniref:S-adenosyl-L-methionine-dependent methyltransferase n=1 Tax=Marasmius oreades TaxID=181124 RepID=A0A9P7UZA1_9AGAR|nr:uncharacterized protein E1B28_004737 [Marasmius oreades]KAG7097387.1 hypothetical protein E1B28_004737 [Marasmius oreades]
MTSRVARTISIQARKYASISASVSPNLSSHSTGPFQVFDREAKRIQRNLAALRDGGASSRTVDYLRTEIADRMMERLTDIKRKFSTIVDLGSGSGHFTKLLNPTYTQKSIMLDPSREMLHRDSDSEFQVQVDRIHADEEELLHILGRESQEAIVSCLSLHWVNDLPGVLIQVKEVLKPDGLFLGAMLGGDTLFELRTSLQLAEVDREGGISPHISPMTDSRDISSLLGRAGLTLLTVDVDEVKVNYPSMWELVDDLKSMGESNAIVGRRHFIHRDTLAAASAIYKELHGNEDGTIPATFQIIFMASFLCPS